MALRKLLITISIFSLVYALGIIKFELSSENLNLIQALQAFRDDKDATPFTTGYKLVSIQDPELSHIHMALKMEILKNTFRHKSIRMTDSSKTDSYESRFSTILIDNINAFRTAINYIDSKRFRFNGYHAVVLLNGNIKDIHEIFTIFWRKNIINVVAFVNDHGTLLLNFDPFANSQKCGDTSPKVINRFENGSFVDKNERSKIFSNMNRCPIKVTTFKEGISIFKETFQNGSFALRGHEIRMIHLLAEMLNFTLNLNFRDGPQQWGSIFENGTFTRAFADLNEGRTDILMGDLFIKKIRMEFFDSSKSYLNRPMLLALSLQPKLNFVEKFLSPFQAAVWILLLLTFCIGVTIILAINLKFRFLKKFFYGYGIKHPITNLIIAFIGQTQSPLPKNNFARFLLMMTLVMCLIIRNLYQGYLYKFLQSDGRHKEPETVDELINDEYTFIFSESNLDFIQHYRPRIKYRTKPTNGSKIINLYSFEGTTEKIAYFCTITELILYSMQYNVFPFRICKEPFVLINSALFFKKKFYLKEQIDIAIQKILIHGFMKHWLREFDKTSKWKYRNLNPIVMTVEHLLGAFYLLLIGNFIGMIAFVAELTTCRLKFIYHGCMKLRK